MPGPGTPLSLSSIAQLGILETKLDAMPLVSEPESWYWPGPGMDRSGSWFSARFAGSNRFRLKLLLVKSTTRSCFLVMEVLGSYSCGPTLSWPLPECW